MCASSIPCKRTAGPSRRRVVLAVVVRGSVAGRPTAEGVAGYVLGALGRLRTFPRFIIVVP